MQNTREKLQSLFILSVVSLTLMTILSLIVAHFFGKGAIICSTSTAYYDPMPPANGVMRFAIVGDYGSDTESEAQVADLIRSWQPEYILTVGDNN